MRKLIVLFCLGFSSAFANVTIVPHGQEVKTPSISANQFYISFAPVLSYDNYSYSITDEYGWAINKEDSQISPIFYADIAWRHNFKEDLFTDLRFGFYTGGDDLGQVSHDSRLELNFLLGRELDKTNSVYGIIGISRISGDFSSKFFTQSVGFTLWQPSIGLGYEYKLSNTFALWAEYSYYFSKSTSVNYRVLFVDLDKKGEMKLSSNKLKAGVRLYF